MGASDWVLTCLQESVSVLQVEKKNRVGVDLYFHFVAELNGVCGVLYRYFGCCAGEVQSARPTDIATLRYRPFAVRGNTNV